MYAILAVATLVENVFPPVPSDVAVALGAFLSHRGVTDPPVVFLVTWTANVGGAVAVYWAARKYGRTFFATRLGRRLLTPGSIELMEREYVRFGIAGIFLSRLFPGFRSFVAPFVGLINLSALKALVPMGLASAVWYGALTALGAALGSEWATINRLVANLNRTLAIVAGVLALGGVVWLLLRRRRRPPQHRLWQAIHRAFGHDLQMEESAMNDPAVAAAAALLLELAQADKTLSAEDLGAIDGYLRARWGIEPPKQDAIAAATESKRPERLDLAHFGSRITQQYARFQRVHLIERLWRVAFSDGVLAAHEDLLMSRAGALLGLDAADVDRARKLAGHGP